MRKIFMILLIILPVISICQEKHSGLSVGFSIGKWHGDDGLFTHQLAEEMNLQSGFLDFQFTSESRLGLTMGFFMEYPVEKSFSLQPELSYTQKGAKFSGTGKYGDYYDSYVVTTDMVYQWDYLDFALLGKFTFTNESIRPYLLAGPGIGYVVSSKMKVNVSVEGESDSDSSKIEADKKTDVNLNLGGGIDFNNQIRLDFRLSSGLTQVLNNENGNGYKLKNRIISINLVACF